MTERYNNLLEIFRTCIDDQDYFNAKRALENLREEARKPIDIIIDSLLDDDIREDWREFFEKDFNIKFVVRDEV